MDEEEDASVTLKEKCSMSDGLHKQSRPFLILSSDIGNGSSDSADNASSPFLSPVFNGRVYIYKENRINYLEAIWLTGFL